MEQAGSLRGVSSRYLGHALDLEWEESIKKSEQKSPFHEIEVDLYTQFLEMRKNARKISGNWLRITAKRIFEKKKSLEWSWFPSESWVDAEVYGSERN